MRFADSFSLQRPKESFDLVFSRVKRGKNIDDELADFFKERARIEDAYAKELSKLLKKSFNHLNNEHLGKFSTVWDNIISNTQETSTVHSNYAQNLTDQVEKKLRARTDNDMEWNSLKNIENDIMKLGKDFEEKHAKYTKTKTKSEKKKTDKSDAKLIAVQNAFVEVKSQLERESSEMFDKLQMIENNRLKSLKECITTLTSIQTDIHKKEMEATDKLLATAVCFEPQEDIDLFCSQKGNKAADVLDDVFSMNEITDSMNTASKPGTTATADSSSTPGKKTDKDGKSATTGQTPQPLVDEEGYAIPQGRDRWFTETKTIGFDDDELDEDGTGGNSGAPKFKIDIKTETIVEDEEKANMSINTIVSALNTSKVLAVKGKPRSRMRTRGLTDGPESATPTSMTSDVTSPTGTIQSTSTVNTYDTARTNLTNQQQPTPTSIAAATTAISGLSISTSANPQTPSIVSQQYSSTTSKPESSVPGVSATASAPSIQSNPASPLPPSAPSPLLVNPSSASPIPPVAPAPLQVPTSVVGAASIDQLFGDSPTNSRTTSGFIPLQPQVLKPTLSTANISASQPSLPSNSIARTNLLSPLTMSPLAANPAISSPSLLSGVAAPRPTSSEPTLLSPIPGTFTTTAIAKPVSGNKAKFHVTVSEVINVLFTVGGKVDKLLITGDIHFTLVESGPVSQEQVRFTLKGSQNLEKIVPNPTYLMPINPSPSQPQPHQEFICKVPAFDGGNKGKKILVMKYVRKTDPQDLIHHAPILLNTLWKQDANAANLLVVYEGNDILYQQKLVVNDLFVYVNFDNSENKNIANEVWNVLMKPQGLWSNDKKMVCWKEDDLDARKEYEDSDDDDDDDDEDGIKKAPPRKLLAKFENSGSKESMKSGVVLLKFVCQNGLLGDLEFESLEAGVGAFEVVSQEVVAGKYGVLP